MVQNIQQILSLEKKSAIIMTPNSDTQKMVDIFYILIFYYSIF